MVCSLSVVYRLDWMEVDILLYDLRQLGNIPMVPYNLIYLLLLGCTLENKRKGNMIVNKSRNIKQQLSIRTFEALILQRTLLLTNLPDQVKNKTERREVKNKSHYEIWLSVFYSLADVSSEFLLVGSLRPLLRFLLLPISWMKTVPLHCPWNNLFAFKKTYCSPKPIFFPYRNYSTCQTGMCYPMHTMVLSSRLHRYNRCARRRYR